MVPVYTPRIEVKLLKMIQRSGGIAERHAAARRDIDLTPYLGDGAQVKIDKGLRADKPAGLFELAFPDRLEASVQDTLYSLIEPMDIIEIRGAREPHRHGGTLPLILRGFVDTIGRKQEVASGGGAPGLTRRVVVNGSDATKLLTIHRVYFHQDYVAGCEYFSAFRLESHLGIDAAYHPVSAFMAALVEKVVNPHVATLYAHADRQVRPFTLRASVAEGSVCPATINPAQKTLWELMTVAADPPWNELWVEDEEDGPVLVFRPTPFQDIAGQLIDSDAAAPDVLTVPDTEIVSLELRRGDHRLANIFTVPPGKAMAASGMAVNASSAPRLVDFDHGNNRPELFAVKQMSLETSLFPTAHVDGDSAGMLAWYARRAELLRDMNRDNSVLEEGSLVAAGRESYRIGRLATIRHGGFSGQAYITSVSHTIAPLTSWTTSLGLIRATNFLERIKMSNSPYLAEGVKGPYSS